MNDDALHLITTWGQVLQLKEDGLLTPAEEALLIAAQTGDTARISGAVPNHKAAGVLIRANLLRYLVLGGCKDFQTQPSGITLSGAWIGGTLDLSYTQGRGSLDIFNCRFSDQANLVQFNVDGLAIVRSHLANGMNAARIQVAGNLTLNGTLSEAKISLSGSDVKGHFSATQAKLRNAGGSALKAQGMKVASSVLLEGLRATGQVSFLGAQIGGQLVAMDAVLDNQDGPALNAQSAVIRGDVFLRRAETVGEVSFMGAEIGGVLDCVDASLRHPDGEALNAQRLMVREGFIWRRLQEVSGAVDLTSAHVGDLWDDPDSWAKCDKLYLSGFRYDVLHGGIDVDDRLAWLKKGAVSRREFYPQPYEQLAKLLRETGHRSDARTIMVAKEQEQRKAGRERWRREAAWRAKLHAASGLPVEDRAETYATLTASRPNDAELARLMLLFPQAGDPDDVTEGTTALARREFQQTQTRFGAWVWWRNLGSTIADKVFGLVVGYGHKPERSFYMLLVLIFAGWFLADRAWETGDFAPTAGPVLMSESWQVLATDSTIENPAKLWSDKYIGADLSPGRDYETFHAAAYAVDLVVPLVSLGQEASWAPSTTRGPWGTRLWWARWWLIALGWIVTAIGAAAVTGVIRRD